MGIYAKKYKFKHTLAKNLTIIAGLVFLISPFFLGAQSKTAVVKNIIFLIGDGMGPEQSSFTRIKKMGADGRLNFEKMPVTGLVNTHAADDLVTDSAAAGTAMATGYKTNNGVISILPNQRIPYTILEVCRDKGMYTGLIATSRITHATPATFASHVIKRSMQAEIARQIINTKVNVLFGGGKDYFIPKSEKRSKRKDNLDLLKLAADVGYCISDNLDKLNNSNSKYLLGLFQMKELTTRSPEPSLEKLTILALNKLNGYNGKGFFLMVEGSQIDWECHDKRINKMRRQVELFDEAVRASIEFAKKDGHTLVVVTGDHETGGLNIMGGTPAGKRSTIRFATSHHTCSVIPLYAFGPGALIFTGMMDNTEIPKKFADLLNIKDFPKLK